MGYSHNNNKLAGAVLSASHTSNARPKIENTINENTNVKKIVITPEQTRIYLQPKKGDNLILGRSKELRIFGDADGCKR